MFRPSASHVSTAGATIEAPINPEGGETSWEIWLEYQGVEPSSQCEPLTVGSQRQQGILSPGFESQTVTDAVTNLQPIGWSQSTRPAKKALLAMAL